MSLALTLIFSSVRIVAVTFAGGKVRPHRLFSRSLLPPHGTDHEEQTSAACVLLS